MDQAQPISPLQIPDVKLSEVLDQPAFTITNSESDAYEAHLAQLIIHTHLANIQILANGGDSCY